MCESSEEYSDNETPMKKCFAVDLPQHFDPNKCPTNGEEYLQLSMYEARQCRSTVSASIDSKKLKPQVNIKGLDSGEDYQKLWLPCSWKTEKLAEFTRFHKYIQRLIQKRGSKVTHTSIEWSSRLLLDPSLSEALEFSISAKVNALEAIVNELQYIQSGLTISDTLGCWIYSMLSLLEIPLSPQIHGIIRDLAKKCLSIRSKLDADIDSNLLEPLNVFILIIGVYYNQLDLADNYTV